MSAVSMEGVAKRFGRTEVVHDLDLELADGEFTVLVGPSGCGKTTTLRMIAGLEDVTQGRIMIGDMDVTRLEPRERDVSMVFQNYALYPQRTVLDNIAFPLLARGGNRKHALEQAHQVAVMLGVSELVDRKPATLSGGQQQRVAIGRAIVRKPQVFLFDEPLSNLDAKLRIEMRTEILRLQRQLGTTTVYVTHDQEEAMTLSDRMVVMRDGRVVQQGRPAELYGAPADTFVATFVGSPKMNLIDGHVTRERFTSESGLSLNVPGAPDGACVLGVRPEDLLLSHEDGEGADVAVEIVELLGPRAITSLAHRDLKLTAVIDAADLCGLHEGQTVSLTCREHGIHVFNPDTTRRLHTT